MTLSNESEESTESTEKSQIDKYGIIDNDQVFCSWEDVKTRDQMAQKLKTEKCRFSMAHQSIYEGGPNVTMFCTYKTCKLAELNNRLSRAGIAPDIPGYVPDWQRNNPGNSRGSWLSNLGFGFDERDDEIMYCIHNDWRARNMIAQIEKTSTHCMFARVCHVYLTRFFKISLLSPASQKISERFFTSFFCFIIKSNFTEKNPHTLELLVYALSTIGVDAVVLR